MSQAPVHIASLARHRGAIPQDFACASTSSAPDGACVHVHLAGELDIAAIAQLQPMLQDAQSRAPLVLLDLRDLTFMDSAGVHTIVNASAAARELGHRLVLLRGPPHIDRVFRLTGNAENVDLQAAEEMQDSAADGHRGDRAQTAA
jgi:anti-anti-sigma factor